MYLRSESTSKLLYALNLKDTILSLHLTKYLLLKDNVRNCDVADCRLGKCSSHNNSRSQALSLHILKRLPMIV